MAALALAAFLGALLFLAPLLGCSRAGVRCREGSLYLSERAGDAAVVIELCRDGHLIGLPPDGGEESDEAPTRETDPPARHGQEAT